MTTKTMLLPLFTLLALTLPSAHADAGAIEKKCEGKDCEPRKVCFNLVCEFRGDGGDSHDRRRGCQAAAQFTKMVEHDGDELLDDSDRDDNPRFEVQCDGDTIFNDFGHRFTNRLGTRLQALTGPYPAILLPRDALSELPHYALSELEIGNRNLRGSCFIYSGEP